MTNVVSESKKKDKPQKKRMGTNMFSRMNYQVQRGMKEIYTIRSLTLEEWMLIVEYFDHHCAYCGIKDTGDTRNGLVADHIVAAADDGDLILGNTIAACHDCNDTRGKSSWEKWVKKKNKDKDIAQMRIEKIEQFMIDYPYTGPKIGAMSRLTPDELEEYSRILHEWSILWQNARKLRNRVKERLKQELNV
ncbi:HNH endonuclease [Paenibacillus taihuensis]|uniref:HNH endonuclease n=1 Tax=Paenibacillus taihuensis TaxID=1156355 RepID=A0A3D9RX67_9BACL|nr:HNH endonuclease [Paenibacillus taihuensis]REE84579.1 HNH endonuclease [Paenibacillus taihuensis]